jgi:hypothetical protein
MSRKEAHRRAKNRNDARDAFDRGQKETVVITEAQVDDDGTALTTVNQIKTFVEPGQVGRLRIGDTVRIKIYDMGSSHANAVAVTRPDEVTDGSSE